MDEITIALLDRLEEASARRGTAEVRAAHLEGAGIQHRREIVAKDKELGELKRLYDSTREELQVSRKDCERTFSVLEDLYEAVVAPKGKRRAADLRTAIAIAHGRLDEEIPF